jgi:hypothetical protein
MAYQADERPCSEVSSMKTTPAMPPDPNKSVLAVPSLARNADLTLNRIGQCRVADMGRMLSNIELAHHADIRDAARGLKEQDAKATGLAA